MQFSNFVRTEEGNKITFYTPNPLNGITDIKYFKDNATGNFAKKEFRWSFNNDYWSAWTPLNQGNLSAIKIGGNQYLFLEIRYLSSGNGAVTSFTLNYDGAAQSSIVGGSCPPDSQYVQTDKSVSPEIYIPGQSCGSGGGPIDAETLCGKSCEYYLWRPNHKGQQPISSITDLQKVLNNLAAAVTDMDIKGALNVDGPGVGVYYGYENKILYFKRIGEGNKTFVTESPDGIITISVDDASINDLFFYLGNLNGVNIGGGSGRIFKQRIGDEFQFRTITSGVGGITIDTIDDRIVINIDSSISGELWVDPDPISATIGGVKSGDTFDGSTSIRVLEKILYEYFPPKVDLNINPSSGYYEKWDPFVPVAQIFGTFDNSNFIKVRVTDVSAYVSINNTSIVPINIPPTHIIYPNVSDGSFSFTDGSFPNWEDVIYHLKFYNNVDSNPMPILDVSIGLKFVEPYIWGIVDDTINSGNISASIIQEFRNAGQKLIVPKKSNEIDFERPSGMFKIKFVYAYPETYGDLVNIFDVRNDFNVTSSFEYTTISINLGAPTLIPYRVYIKRHWIDVSSFKLIFNI